MLAHLEVQSFRNLAPQKLALGPGRHLILGANGAGKTSLLEAVYVLATTRSFRTPKVADCRRHGADSFDLVGEVDGAVRARLRLFWRRGEGVGRTVNDKHTRLAEHLAVLPVLAWTSADAQTLVGPPAERRRLVDRGLVGVRPASIEVLARYRQALRAKRQLLLSSAPARDQLAVWNQLLADPAAEIIRRRADYIRQLEQALGEILEAHRLELPEITLAYRPSPPEGLEGGDSVARVLAAVAEDEIRQQRPLRGPHRDDLRVRWDGHDVRRVASAGERKALGLLLLAAQVRAQTAIGRPPLLLLDDVDTELDALRLQALWPALATGPVIATSNRHQVWERLAIDRRWHCTEGVVRAEGETGTNES